MNSIFLLATEKCFKVDMFKDVYYLLKNNLDTISLEKLYTMSVEYEITPYVFYVLYYTGQIFDDEILEEYIKAFRTPEQKAALQKQCTLWSQAIQNTDIRKSYQYAFKDLFFKNIIGKKEFNKPTSSLKMGNINFLFIHERLLLAILINHPNLLNETSDDFASLEFKEVRLHEVRDAILSFYATGAPNEINLKDFLIRQGLDNEVNAVLSPQVLIHGAFAKPSASLEEARTGWREIFNHIQRTLGKNDIKAAQDFLANEMSAEAWHRLKTLKKSTLIQD